MKRIKYKTLTADQLEEWIEFINWSKVSKDLLTDKLYDEFANKFPSMKMHYPSANKSTLKKDFSLKESQINKLGACDFLKGGANGYNQSQMYNLIRVKRFLEHGRK